MNAPIYKLNKEDAANAGSAFNNVGQTGAHVGEFTAAEAIVASTGTHGIEFSFKTDDGETANYLTLYTQKSDGEKIAGGKMLDALMFLLKVNGIKPVAGKIEKWDKDDKKMVDTEATIYPELMKKKIGLFLRKAEYTKDGGGVGESFEIYACFKPDTKQTVKEIKDKKEATAIDSMTKTVKDKKVSGGGSSSGSSSESSADSNQTDAFEDFDDEDFV